MTGGPQRVRGPRMLVPPQEEEAVVEEVFGKEGKTFACVTRLE